MIQLGDNYSELLATVPNDPRSAKGYSELFALLESLPTDDISAAELKKWMAAVEAHLSSEERSYFREPLQPGVPDTEATFQIGKKNHLTKILLARHSIRASRHRGGF